MQLILNKIYTNNLWKLFKVTIFVNVYSRKYQVTMQQIYLSQNYSMWTRNSPTWDRQLYCNNFPRALSLHNLYIAVKRRAKLPERKIYITFLYFFLFLWKIISFCPPEPRGELSQLCLSCYVPLWAVQATALQ